VTGEIIPPYYSVKEAVFPFIKFPGVDTILGPEMKSTGEVMGVGDTFAEAFVKSQMAASVKLAASPARSSSASRIPTRPRHRDRA
jgi:carbamoyl-phosphate synthase large subunit